MYSLFVGLTNMDNKMAKPSRHKVKRKATTAATQRQTKLLRERSRSKCQC